MRLNSALWLLVGPLLLTVGAVIVFTPKDILRQPVLGVEVAATRPAPVLPVIADEQPELVQFRPATLTVVASAGDFAVRQVEAAPAPPRADRRWITASALNLRAGPGMAHAPVTSLPFGTEVAVHEHSGSWARVEAGGVSGWLSANFLADSDPRR